MARAVVTKHGLSANETSINYSTDSASIVSNSMGTRTNNYVVVNGVASVGGRLELLSQ
jgi:hypothetical protein